MYLIAFLIGPVVILLLVLHWLRGRKTNSKPRICIVVLGDVGRSPRMQYHALSCAKAGYDVELVGFGGISLTERGKVIGLKLVYLGSLSHHLLKARESWGWGREIPLPRSLHGGENEFVHSLLFAADVMVDNGCSTFRGQSV